MTTRAVRLLNMLPAPFDIVVVHSFSRFFRDHFELEFYVRKLAKNGVRLVSIMQEMQLAA
ncbi:DNA invertase Pin-like site-specific DNA recombinase [Pseudochelatococcus lubricantis]|uniref:DNA invertase Pin-like site-specific DNA recombinase n=1 Tax=Pseudochelatococcus lubricantis TaxID=1538102 RepID=A0ABX0V370_9HYPH|nr:DNA invertase Pin-like site-specific DNA recombinase [Pseudochelatococcus lubricantis]